MLRKAFIAVVLVILVAGMASAVTITVDDIIKLHQEGVGTDVIKTFIKSSGQKFDLSTEDILRLKKAGVPEEIIELMINTGAVQETPPPPTNVYEKGEVEPGFPYVKRYHSVFSFQVYKKRRFNNQKVLEVGKRDPLKNKATRGGTLFLTGEEIVVFDMEGDERFRVKYKEITRMKIETRYKGTDARYHPLDTHVLNIYFKKDGMEYIIKIYTLPKTDKEDPNYGDVFDIGNAVREQGKAVNPKLSEPLKID